MYLHVMYICVFISGLGLGWLGGSPAVWIFAFMKIEVLLEPAFEAIVHSKSRLEHTFNVIFA